MVTYFDESAMPLWQQQMQMGGDLLRIDYLPFHHEAEGLVGAFHQADCLLSVATQGNFIDVDKLVSHLEIHSCCLAALFNLKQRCNRRGHWEINSLKYQIMAKTQQLLHCVSHDSQQCDDRSQAVSLVSGYY